MAARASTSSQEGGLVCDGRTAGSRAASAAGRALGSYRSGEHEGGRVVAGESLPMLASYSSGRSIVKAHRTKLRVTRTAGVHGQYATMLEGPAGCKGAYLSMTTAGVWDAMFAAARRAAGARCSSGMRGGRRGREEADRVTVVDSSEWDGGGWSMWLLGAATPRSTRLCLAAAAETRSAGSLYHFCTCVRRACTRHASHHISVKLVLNTCSCSES
jgi:hypothetical protein